MGEDPRQPETNTRGVGDAQRSRQAETAANRSLAAKQVSVLSSKDL